MPEVISVQKGSTLCCQELKRGKFHTREPVHRPAVAPISLLVGDDTALPLLQALCQLVELRFLSLAARAPAHWWHQSW